MVVRPKHLATICLSDVLFRYDNVFLVVPSAMPSPFWFRMKQIREGENWFCDWGKVWPHAVGRTSFWRCWGSSSWSEKRYVALSCPFDTRWANSARQWFNAYKGGSRDKFNAFSYGVESQNYWVCAVCPLLGILNTRKRNILETGSVPIIRWGGRHPPSWVH
jgi:hypothetical protein